MSPYGDVIPIETITTNTTFNNSRFQKPCDSDLKYSKPCDGMTHIALCFATSFENLPSRYYNTHAPNIHFGIFSNETTNVHIWSAWFCTYFDVVTKIFCAQMFITTTTTKAKLILNKLSEVHTYWRFNEHTYSDHKISNPVVTGNYGMMHSKSSVCDPICMTIHMYCESCEWQQVEFMTALNISNHQ